MILNDPITNIQDLNIANFDQDSKGYCCTIVLAAKGYPESYAKGFYIDMRNIIENENIKIFHAGTTLDGNKICSTGGRILTVNAYAENKEKAINIAYENIKKIKVFQDKNMSIENNNLVFFREDIGG
jgi:phosphoribosylamine-glycine ligase